MSGNVPYRPAQWTEPAVTTLTYPGQQSSLPQYSPTGIAATLPANQTVYVFDAVIRLEHDQRLTKTKHPVQTGSNISDHAYMEPAEVVLDIRMSDAMDSYTQGQWSGGTAKSVTCYQIMLALQYSRVPLTLTTKLRTYSNMIIEDLSADDTVKTVYGLSFRVRFSEIFVANTALVPLSTRSQDTDLNQLGIFTPTAPTAATLSQHELMLPTAPIDIPGAGIFSSNNVSGYQGAGQ